MSEDSQLPRRVSHVETEGASVKTEVNNVSKNVDIIVNSLGELRKSIGSSNQTNWGVVFTGIVAFLAVIGLVANIMLASYTHDIGRIEERQALQEERAYTSLVRENERLKQN